jgi:hypothetical protein
MGALSESRVPPTQLRRSSALRPSVRTEIDTSRNPPRCAVLSDTVIDAWLADLVLAAHLAFIAFVIAGALLVLRWPRVAVAHVPAVLWGAYVALSGRVCPLTPLENVLRMRAGRSGYPGGFIDHYVGAIVYPSGLDRRAQWLLAVLVIAWNVSAYAWLIGRRRRSETDAGQRSRAESDRP